MEIISDKYLDFFQKKYNSINIPKLSDKAVVIVEPRILSYLEFVIKNVIYFLPEWSVYIFHSAENEEFVKNITDNSPNINYINFTKGNINIKGYNKLLLSLAFWQIIHAENILIFQSDSFIRRHGIEEYLKYDFIGAPWDNCKSEYQSGNGGFSLRKKSVMVKILQNNLTTRIILNEDIFFGRELVKINAILPSIDVSKTFSVESIYYDDPFGVHKFWHYLDVDYSVLYELKLI
jgi:hypothetical protein